MKTGYKGLNLIKRYEGCKLIAYKPVPTETFWTIGWGHYGADVSPGMVITQAQADAFLVSDLAKFENAVNATGLKLNQNQFDSLVSFAYNCGAGNLKKLVSGRTLPQIAEAMLAYNKGGGKVLAGLTRRRQAERALFLSEEVNGNPYEEPVKTVRYNSRGNDVRWCQYFLNKHGAGLIVDGVFKDATLKAVKEFQKKAFPDNPEEWDGIVGKKTREALKN